jgi:hypothetical protein
MVHVMSRRRSVWIGSVAANNVRHITVPDDSPGKLIERTQGRSAASLEALLTHASFSVCVNGSDPVRVKLLDLLHVIHKCDTCIQ